MGKKSIRFFIGYEVGVLKRRTICVVALFLAKK
jgi:hypothetical protein